MGKTVLILGASGKIGRWSGEAFERAGWQVRRYQRASRDMAAAARGADVIVNGLNPPNYHDWARQIPAITAEVIAAARASGALVIVPANVYNFGARGGEWSESTPHAPHTRKGKIREQMELEYRSSGVRTLLLRAGNFIDSERNGDVLSVFLLRQLASGRIMLAGDPDVPQSYCYVPDWASAAVALAERRDQLATFEDVPFPGHTFSTQQLRSLLEELLGRPLGFTRFPWWALKLSAPFWELGRELLEMRYLWNTPHSLSGTKLARLLPELRATPLRDAIEASLPATLPRAGRSAGGFAVDPARRAV
jgi:nucleoside-diphosphate-sugar epimerase